MKIFRLRKPRMITHRCLMAKQTALKEVIQKSTRVFNQLASSCKEEIETIRAARATSSSLFITALSL